MLKLTGYADHRAVYVDAKSVAMIAPALDGNVAPGVIGKVMGSIVVVMGMQLTVKELPQDVAAMVEQATRPFFAIDASNSELVPL